MKLDVQKGELHLRKYPIGAEFIKGKGVHFRHWSPKRKKVSVVFDNDENRQVELFNEGNGYFSGLVSCKENSLYKYKLDDQFSFPDPVSRFQPFGPHGLSKVIDINSYAWNDINWKGIPENKIIYEFHCGTFTKEGTWKAAEKELKELADLGITIIEVMPVSEFPGNFGWGYDGVDFFAPYHVYGEPDDLKSFIDTAHQNGIAVILDVVYNHFGPDGNYLREFSDSYFSSTHSTDWGDGINYHEKHSSHVREFIVTNALFWIEEYHFDGLRLDATQDIFDKSSEHIIAEISRTIKENITYKKVFLVAENEPQHTNYVKPLEDKGYGIDSLWNDDFHHTAMVAMTGKREAYYMDYQGTPQEFISAIKYGYLFQGQWYDWQNKRRGKPSFGLKYENFVNYTQNHDQIANSGRGLRVHQLTSSCRCKTITGLLMLVPQIPMLFMGQEFNASTPFYYFADHEPKLADMVKKGRIEFLKQFPSISTPEMLRHLKDPKDEKVFNLSKLDFSERETNHEVYAMYKDLISIRKNDPIISRKNDVKLDGAVLAENCFAIRFFSDDYKDDRLLIVNLGIDLHLNPSPEPLLGPPEDKKWKIFWSSDDVKYGGYGTPELDTIDENWKIPAESTVLLIPVEKGKMDERSNKKN